MLEGSLQRPCLPFILSEVPSGHIHEAVSDLAASVWLAREVSCLMF